MKTLTFEDRLLIEYQSFKRSFEGSTINYTRKLVILKRSINYPHNTFIEKAAKEKLYKELTKQS